jgi:hypothetical protein
MACHCTARDLTQADWLTVGVDDPAQAFNKHGGLLTRP